MKSYIKQNKQSELTLRAKSFSLVIQGELLTGRNFLPMVIEKAREFALLEEGDVDQDCIPETYWEQTYQLICEKEKKVTLPEDNKV